MSEHPFNGHARRGNTMSELDATYYCGASGVLRKGLGYGRDAAMSMAWHAIIARDTDAKKLWSELSHEEQETVKGWGLPAPVSVTVNGTVWMLDTENAEREVPLGLDELGYYVDPRHDDCLTRGYMDLGWVVDSGGGKTVYVADNKKGRHTAEGPWSLQLAAYGFAFAQKIGASSYVPGIWVGETKEWLWGEPVVLGTHEASEILDRVLMAAGNMDRDALHFGPHCSKCYAWRRCPAYALPPDPDLAAIDAENPDPAALAEGMVSITAQIKKLEAAQEKIKEHVRRGLTVVSGDWILKATRVKGRRSVSVEDVEKAAPQIIKQGAPTTRVAWVKR